MSLLLYTDTFGHVFSNAWWIYALRLTENFLKTFNEKHQTKIPKFDFPNFPWSHPNLKVLTGIKYLAEMEICRAHVSKFLSFCWFFDCFGCHIVLKIIRFSKLLILLIPLFSNFKPVWHPKTLNFQCR